MKALVRKAYRELAIQDVPAPRPGPKDGVVRVKACAICGSDVHGMDGSTGRRIPPVVMGHEAAGVIEEVGGEVAGFAKGERVTFDSMIYNPESYFSRRGLMNLCDDRRVLGVSCEDYRQDGAFAELVKVPQHILYRIPERMTFEQAALVEPVSVTLHALKLTPLQPGDSAVVFGAGLIGLAMLQVLRQVPLRSLVAVDVVDERLALAKELGAQQVLNSSRDDVPAA